MFKTLSARIRGSKIELEELGEEEDQYTKSTSKLRDLVKGVTGFDIMKDENTYKDLYEILDGIGQKYKDLTDVERAGLLEALGGKRATNALSALLDNVDMLEKAYATAEGAEGSAMREQENYAQSVEYSLNRAKASIQELGHDFLSSDFLKGAIDAGNQFIQVIDNIVEHFGPLLPLLGVVGGVNYGLGKMDPSKPTLMSSLIGSFNGRGQGYLTFGSTKNMVKQAYEAGDMDFMKSYLSSFAGASENSRIRQANKALKQLDIGDATSQLYMLAEAFDKTDEEVEKITERFSGLKSIFANVGEGFKSLGTSLLGMITSPAFLVTAGITIATAAWEAHLQRIEQLKEEGKQAAEEWKKVTEDVESYQTSFKQLREKLDSGTLSDEETRQVKMEIYELQQQIVEEYDSQASAIDLVNGNLETQLALLGNITREVATQNQTMYQASYDYAAKQMENVKPYSFGIIDTKTLNAIRPALQKYGIEPEFYGGDDWLIGIEADALEAQRVMQGVDKELTNIRENYVDSKDDKNGMFQKIQRIQEAIVDNSKKVEKTISESGSAYDAYLQGELYILKDNFLDEYKDAVSDYNKALATGTEEEIQSAKEVYDTAQDSFNEFFKDESNQKFAPLFNNIVVDEDLERAYNYKTLLGSISKERDKYLDTKDVEKYKDSVEKILTDSGVPIIRDSFSEGFNEFVDKGFDEATFRSTIDNLVKDYRQRNELRNQGVPLLDNAQTALEQFLLDSANAFDLSALSGDDYTAALDSLVNVMAELGYVQKSTSDATRELTVDIADVATAAHNAISAIDSANAAIVSSMSGKGMSYEYAKDEETGQVTWSGDVQNIMDSFGKESFKKSGLYNAATLFRRTANGVKINTKELRKLQKAQEDITRQKFYEKQKELTDALTAAELERAAAAANGQDTSSINARIAEYQNELNQVNLLASAYDGATSAYQKWLDAQGLGEGGEYDNITSNLFKRGEELRDGWVGSEEFRAIAELLSGEDLTSATVDQIVSAYDRATQTIEGTHFKLKDFFTEDTEGVFNFADALVDLDFGTLDEAGYHFERLDIDKIAKKFGTDASLIQIAFDKMKMAGFNFEWFTHDQMDELQKVEELFSNLRSKTEEKNRKLPIEIDDTSTNLQEINSDIFTLQQMVENPTRFGLDTETLQTAIEELELLEQKKEILTGYDTSAGVTTAAIEAGGKALESLHASLEGYSKAGLEVNVDDETLVNAASIIETLPPELKVGLGFNVDATAQQIIDQLIQEHNLEIDLKFKEGLEGYSEEVQTGIAAGRKRAGWTPKEETDPIVEGANLAKESITEGATSLKDTIVQSAINFGELVVSAGQRFIDTITGKGNNNDNVGVKEEWEPGINAGRKRKQKREERQEQLDNIHDRYSKFKEEQIDSAGPKVRTPLQKFVDNILEQWDNFGEKAEQNLKQREEELQKPLQEQEDHLGVPENLDKFDKQTETVISNAKETIGNLVDNVGKLGEWLQGYETFPTEALPEEESTIVDTVSDTTSIAENIGDQLTVSAEEAGEILTNSGDTLGDTVKADAESASKELTDPTANGNFFMKALTNNGTPYTTPNFEQDWTGIGDALTFTTTVDASELEEIPDKVEEVQDIADEGATVEIDTEFNTEDGKKDIEKDFSKNPVKAKVEYETPEYTPMPAPTSTPTSAEKSSATPQPTVSPTESTSTVKFVPDTSEADAAKAELEIPIIEPIEIDPNSEEFETLKAKANETSAAIDEVDSKDPTVTINADDSQVKAAQPNVDQLAQDRSGSVTVTAVDNGVRSLLNLINAAKDKTITFTTITKTVNQTGTSPVNGTAHAFGTALSHFYGSAHVGGDWRTKKDEVALTAELGPEIMVNGKTGQWELLGVHGAQFTNVPAGSIIFNHKQTEDLLEHGYTLGRAHAQGTAIGGSAYVSSSGRGSGPTRTQWRTTTSSGSGNNGGGNNNNGGNNNSSSDTTKKESTAFSDWLSGLFDWAEIRLTRLNRLTEKWSNKAEEAVKYAYNNVSKDKDITQQYKDAANYLTKAIKATANEITGQQKAQTTYEKQLTKIAKKGGLSASTLRKIEDDTINGTFNIASYKVAKDSSSGSNKKTNKQVEAINAYKDYYEKVLACRDATDDLITSQKELYEKLYNLPLDKLNSQLEKLSKNLSTLQRFAGLVSNNNANIMKITRAGAQKDLDAANKELASKTTSVKDKQDAVDKRNYKTAVAQAKANEANRKLKDAKGTKAEKKAKKDADKANRKLKKAQAKEVQANKALTDAKSGQAEAQAKVNNAKQRVESSIDVRDKRASETTWEYQNYLLDKSDEIAADEVNKAEGVLDEMEKSANAARARADAAEAKATKTQSTVDTKGKAITSSKAFSKLSKANKARIKQAIENGEEISKAGIKNKSVLKLINQYNASLKNNTKAQNENEVAKSAALAAEDALDQAYDVRNEQILNQTELLQENAKARVDNIIAEYEAQQESLSDGRANLQANREYDTSTGKHSQYGGEAEESLQTEIKLVKVDRRIKQQEYDKVLAEFKKNRHNMSEEAIRETEKTLKNLETAIVQDSTEINNLQDELNNFTIGKLGIALDKLTVKLNKAKDAADELQDNMDLKTEKGLYADENDYQGLIDNAAEQKAILADTNANLREQNEELAKQQEGLDKTSEKYLNLQKQIDDNESSIRANDDAIRDANKSTVTWLNTMGHLKLDRLERALELIKSYADVLQSQQDIRTTIGFSLDEADYQASIAEKQKQKNNLAAQRAELVAKRDAALAAEDGVFEGKNADEWQKELNAIDVETNSITKSQEELNNAIAQLPTERLQKYLDLLDSIATLNKSASDLKAAQGYDLSKEDYETQMRDARNQASQYERLAAQAYTDYQKAVARGGAYGGKDAETYLQEYNKSIASANNMKASVEELKKTMRDDVFWRDFERAHKALEAIATVIQGIDELITEDMFFTKDGAFTDFGVSHIANLTKEFENAKEQVEDYSKDITNLYKLYNQGYYSQDEFNDKLNELQGSLYDSAASMKSYLEEIKNMFKEMDEKELDNLYKLIDARKQALDSKRACGFNVRFTLIAGIP